MRTPSTRGAERAPSGKSSAAPSAAPRYGNRATLNVLAVLSRFIGETRSLGVTEIAADLGMSKNMAHRALATLIDSGLLARDASLARCQIGLGALAFAGDDESFDLRALCRPFMRELAALSGETVVLSVIAGRSRINIDALEARGPRVTLIRRGSAAPLHCSKLSRLLLAYLSDAEIAEYIRVASPLNQFPETPDDNAEELAADIKKIRARGHIVWRGARMFPSACYVTFPVLDAARRPHGAITVGGPAERFPLERARQLLPAIERIVAQLNQHARLYPASPAFFPSDPG